MDIYNQIASKIIKGQKVVIGPLALDQANQISGIKIVDKKKVVVEISGNGKNIIDQLVNQYAQIFGKASIEVCRDAISNIKSEVSAEDLPDVLK